jgi:hypothetical protein
VDEVTKYNLGEDDQRREAHFLQLKVEQKRNP